MAGGSDQLTIRSSLRRVIGLDADFTLDSEHMHIVRLTGNVTLRNGAIPATAVDISDGGVGVLTTTFVPKRSLGTLRILNPRDNTLSLFSSRVRVARSQMVDRRPGYMLGLLFEDDSEGFEERLMEFLAMVDEVM
ncbi:MAG: PilZ domain-containing protein [Phycisphaerales bacterium JB043]